MQIILKHRTQFYNPANTRDGEILRTTDNSVIIGPGNHIQTVPDWIKETPEFAARRKDGSLILVQTLDDVPKAPIDPTAPTAPTSGWGAKPEGIGNGFSNG